MILAFSKGAGKPLGPASIEFGQSVFLVDCWHMLRNTVDICRYGCVEATAQSDACNSMANGLFHRTFETLVPKWSGSVIDTSHVKLYDMHWIKQGSALTLL